MTTIAQAYLHTTANFTEAEIDDWGRAAEELAYEIARSVFPVDVELEVVFQTGSLITRVIVIAWGGFITAYGAIATYPDFKQGLGVAIEDAQKFAGEFNSRFMSEAGIKANEIIARQRRTETPGRINRALDRLTRLEQDTAVNLRTGYHQEFHDAVSQLHRGLSDLEPADRQQATELIVQHHAPLLPEPLPPQLTKPIAWRREDEEFGLVGLSERSDIKFLANLRTDRPLRGQLLLADKDTERGKISR